MIITLVNALMQRYYIKTSCFSSVRKAREKISQARLTFDALSYSHPARSGTLGLNAEINAAAPIR